MSIDTPIAPTRNDAAHTRRRRLRITPGHPGLVLAVILSTQLMVVLDATIVNIALPQIKSALGFNTADLSWVLNAYTLAFGGFLLLGARSGDLIGRRRTLVGGLIIFTVASFAGGLAQDSAMLLTARALQGIGGAFAAPSGLALLMAMFPQGRERTRAIGYYTAVSIGGSAVGLIAGGVLVEWFSWRWVMFVNVPIGIAAVVLARLVLPETPRAKGHFDLPGAITSTLGMSALVYGFVEAATKSWTSPVTLTAFVVGAALMVAFIVNESRAAMPITPLRLFTDRTRNAALVSRMLLVAGVFGLFFFLSQFLQEVLHYSPLRTGFAFLPLTILLFVSSQLASRVLVERFDRRLLIAGGIVLTTIGVAWLIALSPGSGYGMIFGPLALVGLGNGTAFVPLTTAALDNLAPSEAGAAAGLVNVAQQLGGSLGLAILVTVFGSSTRHAARQPISGRSVAAEASHVFTYGADRVFAMATVFLIATVVLAALAIRKAEPATEAAAVAEEIAATVDYIWGELFDLWGAPARRRSNSCYPLAASWPQAPSISRPRVSRTVTATPRASSRRTNSRSTFFGDASHSEPGVGFNGIRLTCTRRPPSRSPSRSARSGWSFTSRIIAYSIEYRRPVRAA